MTARLMDPHIHDVSSCGAYRTGCRWLTGAFYSPSPPCPLHSLMPAPFPPSLIPPMPMDVHSIHTTSRGCGCAWGAPTMWCELDGNVI